jgi:hypothetical protein
MQRLYKFILPPSDDVTSGNRLFFDAKSSGKPQEKPQSVKCGIRAINEPKT